LRDEGCEPVETEKKTCITKQETMIQSKVWIDLFSPFNFDIQDRIL
jgi:hypothetical protein